jgi:hypothetical protein
VSNSYYTFPATINAYTLADAKAVAAQFTSVQVAFDKLPSPDELAQNRLGFLTDTGTVNAIVAAFPTAATAYGSGMTFTTVIAAANTGATTANINGLGAKSVLRADGAPLQAGDLTLGCIATFKYDGTAFRLTGGGSVAMNERILAQAAATSAISAPGTSANSVSSVAIGTGTKTWAIEPGKLFEIGQTLVAADTANPLNQMIGVITVHDKVLGNITLSVSASAGTGTKSSWKLSLSASAIATYGSVTGAGLASGSGSTSSDVTIAVPAASNADVLAATSAAKAVTPKSIADAAGFQTLTDAATVAWDTNNGFNAKVTLTAGVGSTRVIGNPSNLKDGWSYTLRITQPSSGSALAVTWAGKWDWGTDGAPSLSAINKSDYIFAFYDGTADKLIAQFRKAA